MSAISSNTAAQLSQAQAAQVANEASIAVAKKSLDVSKQQGQAVNALLEAAIEVQRTGNAARPSGTSAMPGIGTRLDVTG